MSSYELKLKLCSLCTWKDNKCKNVSVFISLNTDIKVFQLMSTKMFCFCYPDWWTAWDGRRLGSHVFTGGLFMSRS